MLLQEPLAIILVSESFRSSRPGHGKRARAVAAGQAGREIGPAEIFVEEAGVETVPGPDRIDRRDLECKGW